MSVKVISRAQRLEAGEVYAVPLLGGTGWTLVQVRAIRDLAGESQAALLLHPTVHELPPPADELDDALAAPYAVDLVPTVRPRDWHWIASRPVEANSTELPVCTTGGRFLPTERPSPPATAEHPFIFGAVERRDDPDEAESPSLCHGPYDLVDWERRLATTTEMSMHGDEHGLAWILEQRPWVGRLIWTGHRHDLIDLSRTTLGSLDLEVPVSLRVVRLPSTIGSIRLRITDPQRLPRFELEGRGRGTNLEITGSPLVALDGLEDVAMLTVEQTGQPLDAASVSHYRAVERCRIRRPSGSLDSLTGWRQLRTLVIDGALDVDVERIPSFGDWDRMDRMTIVEISQPDSVRIQDRLGPDAHHLELRKIRSTRWLDTQAGNPFRNWTDRGPAVGRLATSLWKRVRKLDEAGEPERAVRTLVRGLNRMMRDVGVESAERDDAFEYALEIGARHGHAALVVSEWFDAGREF